MPDPGGAALEGLSNMAVAVDNCVSRAQLHASAFRQRNEDKAAQLQVAARRAHGGLVDAGGALPPPKSLRTSADVSHGLYFVAAPQSGGDISPWDAAVREYEAVAGRINQAAAAAAQSVKTNSDLWADGLGLVERVLELPEHSGLYDMVQGVRGADADAARRVLEETRRAATTYASEIGGVERRLKDHAEAWSSTSRQPDAARQPRGFWLILDAIAECATTLKALDHSLVAYDAMLGDVQSG